MATDNAPLQNSKGFIFVSSSFAEARRRLASMIAEKNMRNEMEIWEAYCDLEQAIQVSKYVFGLQDRLAVIRRLTVSAKNDPATLPQTELARRFKLADANIEAAEVALRDGRGEEEIEFARKARDELKIMLLGRRKAELASERKSLRSKSGASS